MVGIADIPFVQAVRFKATWWAKGWPMGCAMKLLTLWPAVMMVEIAKLQMTPANPVIWCI